MDLTKIDNLTQLKAIAYDIIRERDTLTIDFEKVNKRIAQLEEQNISKKQAGAINGKTPKAQTETN